MPGLVTFLAFLNDLQYPHALHVHFMKKISRVQHLLLNIKSYELQLILKNANLKIWRGFSIVSGIW